MAEESTTEQPVAAEVGSRRRRLAMAAAMVAGVMLITAAVLLWPDGDDEHSVEPALAYRYQDGLCDRLDWSAVFNVFDGQSHVDTFSEGGTVTGTELDDGGPGRGYGATAKVTYCSMETTQPDRTTYPVEIYIHVFDVNGWDREYYTERHFGAYDDFDGTRTHGSLESWEDGRWLEWIGDASEDFGTSGLCASTNLVRAERNLGVAVYVEDEPRDDECPTTIAEMATVADDLSNQVRELARTP